MNSSILEIQSAYADWLATNEYEQHRIWFDLTTEFDRRARDLLALETIRKGTES